MFGAPAKIEGKCLLPLILLLLLACRFLCWCSCSSTLFLLSSSVPSRKLQRLGLFQTNCDMQRMIPLKFQKNMIAMINIVSENMLWSIKTLTCYACPVNTVFIHFTYWKQPWLFNALHTLLMYINSVLSMTSICMAYYSSFGCEWLDVIVHQLLHATS